MLVYMKILNFFSLIIWTQILLWPCVTFTEGTKCPGQCISPKKCKEKGGKILAYCTNTKACCGEPQKIHDVCNQNKWNVRQAIFKSPNYPESYEGSLVCQFRLNLFPTTKGVQLDFLDLSLPIRPGSEERLGAAQQGALACDSDMFFIQGFSNWMPDAKCGNLTGQSTVLELEEKQQHVSLLFVMSSAEYKWNIKLTQISSKDVKRTERCWKRKMEMWNKDIGEEYQYNNEPSLIDNNTQTNNSTLKLINILSTNTDDYDDDGYVGDSIGPLPLIENGQITRLEEIPWQVSIQKKFERVLTPLSNVTVKKCPLYRNGGTRHNCGGSIIGERHILTASHCVLNRDVLPRVYHSDELKIHVGDYDFCSLNETSNFEIHEVEKIIFHFNYIQSVTSNDIAVIILKKKIKFGKSVRPIPLASSNLGEIEYENTTNLLFSGWGNRQKIDLADPFATSKVKYPTKMRKTTKLTVNDLDECNEGRYYELTGIENGTSEEAMTYLSNKYGGSFDNWICTTGENDGNPSFGDSGGPLVALDENWKDPYLIGVVSYISENPIMAFGNGKKRMSLFTKVTSYLDWIHMALNGEC